MQRLRLHDCQNSRLPGLVGLCQADLPNIANYVNSAQRRLLLCREAGNDGWWGTFAEMAFNVNPHNPYITLPREVARIMYQNWCDFYVPIQNQFFEYLTFGNGRLPKRFQTGRCFIPQTYSRNNVVLFTDLSTPPQYIRARITEQSDEGKRTLIQGTDSNDMRVYSQSGVSRANGVFVTFEMPFVTTDLMWNTISGIQKDVTDGQVNYYQVDPNTGDEVLLLTMEPGETTASYRRYYLNNMPCDCCPPPSNSGQVQVTAIVKLDLIPVVYDTDYCLIQNLEAIINEAQSVRWSEMDNPNAAQLAANSHRDAVRLLNGELNHYLGQEQPAVGLKPFGSADLWRQAIGYNF